ncbi:hypothetical protein A5747_13280 [Mycobacterium sp. IS-836]|nr:hypothetical protein A5747_13280 [Mycobacterium sp. IS-836]
MSEHQVPVDDSYKYEWIAIRSNDGDYRDQKFAQNYAWCVKACDEGWVDDQGVFRKLKGFFVYFYWHTNWQTCVDTHRRVVQGVGGPHPKMVSMIDAERGGNPPGDFSDALNATDDALVSWLGDGRRVVAYGNTGDLNSMWSNRREDQLIVASYGSNPDFPGKFAHQYTDGGGYGGGLPEGASPFGNCDMNSADGYSPDALAVALGVADAPQPKPTPEVPVSNPPAIPKPADMATQTSQVWDQLLLRWDMLNGRTPIEAIAEIGQKLGLPYSPPSN